MIAVLLACAEFASASAPWCAATLIATARRGEFADAHEV